MSDVTFTSWGSANSIGASCHVLTFGGRRIGIDYGAGVRSGEEEPQHDGPLDDIFITHGHRDHVGMLPRALARWPATRWWGTFVTREIASWIWSDALRIDIQEQRPSAFTTMDATRAYSCMKLVVAGTKIHLDDHLTVTPFSAGHILGAVGFIFEYRGERYVITGDINLKNHGFVSSAEVPEFSRTRLLIRESTYAGQLPTKTRSEIEGEFIASIRAVLQGGGRVVIPALAIDRMAEIFALLHQSGLESQWPLRVVGGARPTEIYYEYAPRARVLGSMRRFEGRYEQLSARKSREPLIVLASSGMLAKDTPSYAWATEVLGDSSSAIFMVNWQDPCTPGGAVLNSEADAEVLLPTGTFSRKCRVERFDFSSHAKEDEMSVIEERLKPDVIVHVHGEDARINEFLASTSDRSRRHKAEVGVTLKL